MRVITRKVGESAYIYIGSWQVGKIDYLEGRSRLKPHRLRVRDNHNNGHREFFHAGEHLFLEGGHVVFYEDPKLGGQQLKMMFDLPRGFEVCSESRGLKVIA